jgi:SpoVK/Ycf46/Vps4 family AAA+-type ATPase
VCLEAKQSARRRQKASGKEECITNEDFAGALAKSQASVKPEDLKAFTQWREERQRPADSDED